MTELNDKGIDKDICEFCGSYMSGVNCDVCGGIEKNYSEEDLILGKGYSEKKTSKLSDKTSDQIIDIL